MGEGEGGLVDDNGNGRITDYGLEEDFRRESSSVRLSWPSALATNALLHGGAVMHMHYLVVLSKGKIWRISLFMFSWSGILGQILH